LADENALENWRVGTLVGDELRPGVLCNVAYEVAGSAIDGSGGDIAVVVVGGAALVIVVVVVVVVDIDGIFEEEEEEVVVAGGTSEP
jgi:hypothetical protein